MKIILHKADTRGGAEHDWLKTRHSFSFADWYEPARMSFGALRVLNDDVIAPESGFGRHPHRDMEIITIVMEGVVTHTDDLNNSDAVEAGEVQVMTAGRGVIHAEENRSSDTTLKLFQIWIEPNQYALAPHYEKRAFGPWTKDRLEILVAPIDRKVGQKEALGIHQDAYIFRLEATEPFQYQLQNPLHGVYVFVVEGAADVAGMALAPRDALGISETQTFEIVPNTAAKLLLIEVPLQ